MNELQIVERGCGWPEAGKAYLHLGVGPNGVPPGNFLIDYPQPTPSELVIKDLGMTMIQDDAGIWHIVDHIGNNAYPNFPDWFEELSRYGLHQKVERTLPFDKLTPKSRFLLTHDRGLLRNAKDVTYLIEGAGHDSRMRYDFCPTHKHDLDWTTTTVREGMCVNALWQALLKGKHLDSTEEGDLVVREMPSFRYYGYEIEKKLKWEPAFLASFPLSMLNILVYKGEGEQDTLDALEAKAPDFLKEKIRIVEV